MGNPQTATNHKFIFPHKPGLSSHVSKKDMQQEMQIFSQPTTLKMLASSTMTSPLPSKLIQADP